MSHLGVVAVLDVLPLQIQEVVRSLSPSRSETTVRQASERRADGESRTWLLPMIKRYARCDNLTDWMERLLPIAVLARQRAQQLSTSDPESEFKCATLERQIWQTLPSFCLWARDIPSGFEYPLADFRSASHQGSGDLRAGPCRASSGKYLSSEASCKRRSPWPSIASTTFRSRL